MRRRRRLGPQVRKRKRSGGMGRIAPRQDQSRVSSAMVVRFVDPETLKHPDDEGGTAMS